MHHQETSLYSSLKQYSCTTMGSTVSPPTLMYHRVWAAVIYYGSKLLLPTPPHHATTPVTPPSSPGHAAPPGDTLLPFRSTTRGRAAVSYYRSNLLPAPPWNTVQTTPATPLPLPRHLLPLTYHHGVGVAIIYYWNNLLLDGPWQQTSNPTLHEAPGVEAGSN